ncbi:MAG: tetratricopeptide repeat protein [Spongiibacteraceae bacterium]
MAYQTEEEQLEALKAWFRQNGRHLVTGMLVAAVAAFGIFSWQQRQAHRADSASADYQNLLQAMRALDANAGDAAKIKEQLATARHLAETLKTDFESSSYAQFAALFKAKLAVDENDLAQAETELKWVLEHKPTAEIKALTQLRLARVLFAKGDNDGALAQLDEKSAGSYIGAYLQLKGDIAQARGDVEAARAAYVRAQELEKEMSSPINDPLLEMKLRDLQASPETSDAKVQGAS